MSGKIAGDGWIEAVAKLLSDKIAGDGWIEGQPAKVAPFAGVFGVMSAEIAEGNFGQ